MDIWKLVEGRKQNVPDRIAESLVPFFPGTEDVLVGEEDMKVNDPVFGTVFARDYFYFDGNKNLLGMVRVMRPAFHDEYVIVKAYGPEEMRPEDKEYAEYLKTYL